MADEMTQNTEASGDADLDKIIQEIAALDAQMMAEPTPAPAPAPEVESLAAPVAPVAAPVAATPQMEAVAPTANTSMEPQLATVHSLPTSTVSTAGTSTDGQVLSLEMGGVKDLRLSFSMGGRAIKMQCTESALILTMGDGAEFRLPLGGTATNFNKKVA